LRFFVISFSCLFLILFNSVYADNLSATYGADLFPQASKGLIRCITEKDAQGRLVKLIFDDSQMDDKNNLQGITFRQIFYFTFCEEGCHSELPVLIEEKRLDLSSGQEIFLRSTANTYSSAGRLTHRVIFEGLDKSTYLDYDEHGNLLTIINQDGQKVTSEDMQQILQGTMLNSSSEERVTLDQVDNWGNFNELTNTIAEGMAYVRKEINTEFEKFGYAVLGKALFDLIGYYEEATEQGILGEGEVSDKLRITLTNGILNTKADTLNSAGIISKTHGGVNVHYLYRATQGWTRDLVNCTFVKFGYISEEAYILAVTWRRLIQEMGGVNSGGIVIHYAHSIGGTESYAAKDLLTAEERKMIKVITIGSATLHSEDGFHNVTHYVSRRDGVSFFSDPVGYFYGIFSVDSNVVFVGDFFGFPGIDHSFGGDTYRTVLEELGKVFVETYGSVKELKNN